jgi:pyridoxamine 5'-phosphate oxidase
MKFSDLSQARREYSSPPFDESNLADDPYKQFEAWFQLASSTPEIVEANAMSLATVSSGGEPSQRTVLLKIFDAQGFVFFTNFESRKARQISENHRVSLLFQWLPLHRQVEINGRANKISTLESVRYFATRPRGSQLGAWVSQQSSVITSRSLLEGKFEELKQKFASREIPIPSFWGGYRVAPSRFEFWQGRPNRLHDRFEYVLSESAGWRHHRLSP